MSCEPLFTQILRDSSGSAVDCVNSGSQDTSQRAVAPELPEPCEAKEQAPKRRREEEDRQSLLDHLKTLGQCEEPGIAKNN